MGSLTGSELLARSLTSQGMDTLFFLMGGPMLETESACLKLGVRAIDTRHEQAAAMMAHAYSRTTRRPGVCMGCSGPGTTNLVTGVANAFVDAAPLIAVGGSSPRVYLGMEAFQEIDQVAIMRPVTKWAERVLDARRIPELVATAFRQATTGRPGPVYLDLPGDVLGEAVDEAHVAFPTRWQPGPRAQGNPAAIADAVAMLERAERPLIIGGSGGWWSGAAPAFQDLGEASGVPFYSSPIPRGVVDRGRYASWVSKLRTLDAEKAAEMDKQMRTDQVPIHPLRLCKEVRDFLRRDAILVVDGQEILNYGRQSIPTFAPGHRLNSGPFGCMGVGLPFGIGAKVAHPDPQVVVLHGDGSYGINAMEIDTAVRHGIPVLVVISNNGGWTADPQRSKPGRTLGFTRYDKVAQDFGAHGEYVEKPHEIRPALERAWASGKPAVVNVVTDDKARAQTIRFSAYTT